MNKFLLGAGIVTVYLLALLLETTIVNFPFIFLMGAVSMVIFKKIPVYVSVFLVGIIIDSLRITDFGLTPLFLMGTLGIIFLYEKYSGSADPVVAGFIITVMTLFYTKLLNYSFLVTVTFIASLTIFWIVYRLYIKRRLV